MTISMDNKIEYIFSGLFEAKNDEWMHMSRQLLEYQLMVVIEGTLYIADENQKYTVKKGEYIIMEPGKQYGWKQGGCSFFWLHFNPLGNENDAGFFLENRGVFFDEGRIRELFTNLIESELLYQDEMTNCDNVIRILLEIRNQQIYEEKKETTNRELLITQIKNFVKWNRSYRPTVGDLASYTGYHPKYLSSLFHKETNMTLKQFLMQEIMNQAKEELTSTNQKILSIALGLGFCDGHAFSCAFKKHVGITPTEYRKKHLPIGKNSD